MIWLQFILGQVQPNLWSISDVPRICERPVYLVDPEKLAWINFGLNDMAHITHTEPS